MGITHDELAARVASLENYFGLRHTVNEDGEIVHEPAVDETEGTVHEPEQGAETENEGA
jgi:hypothetical protein